MTAFFYLRQKKLKFTNRFLSKHTLRSPKHSFILQIQTCLQLNIIIDPLNHVIHKQEVNMTWEPVVVTTLLTNNSGISPS